MKFFKKIKCFKLPKLKKYSNLKEYILDNQVYDSVKSFNAIVKDFKKELKSCMSQRNKTFIFSLEGIYVEKYEKMFTDYLNEQQLDFEISKHLKSESNKFEFLKEDYILYEIKLFYF